MPKSRVYTLSFVFSLYAASCVPAGSTAVQRDCRGIEPNGPDLNGTAMTGRVAQSCPIRDDLKLRVVNLEDGVTLASGEVLAGAGVRLESGALAASGRKLADFVGATLHGVAETKQGVLVRIDSIVAGETAPEYRLSYKWQDGEDRWMPLCKDGASAVAVNGQWDLGVSPGGGGKKSIAAAEVTFACQGSAIAKCVTLLKYRPWSSTAAGASLDVLHQSCVRAVRADYCGNGQSNTRRNQQVNFYDSAGVQRDGADWPLEAIWTPDGARCVESTRLAVTPADPRTQRPEESIRDYLARTCPQVLRPCAEIAGAGRAGDALLLYTEVAPSDK